MPKHDANPDPPDFSSRLKTVLVRDLFRLPGSPEDPADPEFRCGVDVTHVVPAEATPASRVYLLLTKGQRASVMG